MGTATTPLDDNLTSYCRWSSDSYRSDLFCQRTTHGYETHVAVLRRVLEDDAWAPALDLLTSDPDRFYAEHRSFTCALDSAHRVPIGLAMDGLSFMDETEDAMLARVAELSAMGYRVPEHVIEMATSRSALSAAS